LETNAQETIKKIKNVIKKNPKELFASFDRDNDNNLEMEEFERLVGTIEPNI
jgi:hypothetical protein